jgi:dihydropteroate synthase
MPVRVIGIINASPESFYENSIKTNFKEISKAARIMQEEGADIIDVGAMSTAPYLETMVSAKEEIKRMKFTVEAVRDSCSLPISIDTPRSIVAKEAIDLGIDAINDITGLKYDENMKKVVSEFHIPVIIGAFAYKKGGSRSNLGRISGTVDVLRESIKLAKKAGVGDDNIIIDPSIGFFREEGKNPFFTQIEGARWYIRDIEVISKLTKIKTLSKPVCISVSRKSFIGALLGLDTQERLVPSIVSEVVSIMNGANVVRTHNVKETVQALTMLDLLY